MKKAAIYFNYNRKCILSNELTERSLKEYAKSLPDVKAVTVYTDISGNIFSEPKQKKKSSMIHQKMREEWHKDLREHHKCIFEALANKK